jgi:glycosyltransferase 2 family protein
MGADEEVKKRFPFRQIAKWILVLIIFTYLGKMVRDHWNEIRSASFTLRGTPFSLGTLLFILSYFVQAGAWYLITLKVGIALPLRETTATWFYSQLGKYLPGKVWLFIGRFYLYESKGRGRQEISLSLYFETVTLLMAAGLISLTALAPVGIHWIDPRGGWFPILLVALSLFFLILHPRILEKIINPILSLLGKNPLCLSISYRDILGILLVNFLAWCLGGLGFYFFIDSIFPVASGTVLFLSGALALSSTLGLVAVFAPGGLGIREGVLVYLLSHIMPGAVAVVLSILTRLWMTLIEVGLVGMIYIWDRFRTRQDR